MMRPHPWNQAIQLVILLVVVTLSGCTGSGNDDLEPGDGSTEDSESRNARNEPAREPEPTSDTGSIHGQVVDDAYEPINGAQIAVSNNTGTFSESMTDEKGKYTINDIPPGKYGIRFTAECCQEHLDQIRVHADRTTTSSPVLTAWGGHEPYTHPDEWQGFICADGPENIISWCSLYDDNHKQRYDFDVQRGIETLLVALSWNDGINNVKNCLWMEVKFKPLQDDFSGQIKSSDPCQDQPIEFRIDAGEMDPESDFENITDQVELQYHVRAQCTAYETGCSGLDPELPPNIVYQQSFTVHWEEYYWEPAPEGASALPDQ